MSGMWARSLEAAASARLNFKHALFNRAVSSAYYAIFCAARAALRYIHPDLDMSKTHAGVIRRFGLELVVREGLDPALVRLLADMEGIRLDADYEDEAVTFVLAQQTFANMETFLAAIAAFIGQDFKAP